MKKNYSEKTKLHTIKLVTDKDHSVKEAANEMNVSEATVYRWVSEHKRSLNNKVDFNKREGDQLRAENILLKKALFLSRKKEDIFEFIYENKDTLSIQRQCKIFGVSSSGYYKYISSNTSLEEIHHKKITRLVKEIYLDKGPDITNLQIAERINQYEKITSPATVARIMKKHKEKWHQSHSQFHQDKDVVLNFNNKDTLFNQQSKTYYHEKFAKKEINDFLNNYTITNITKHTDSTIENVQKYSLDDNLLFKADNLFALYHLQKEFKNKIKLIYIDVPYNTRNEKLSYKDSLSKSDYLLSLKNRLELAKNLMKKNASIFIQCDDNEQAYIKVLCDEIFGIENFVHQIVWKRSNSQQNNTLIATKKEYILVYAKNKKHLTFNNEPISEKQIASYKFQDNKGRYRINKLQNQKMGHYNYFVTSPNQEKITYNWLISKEAFNQLLDEDMIHWSKQNIPYRKVYLSDDLTMVPNDLWIDDEVYGTTRQASLELSKGMSEYHFTYPKPEKLLKNIIKMASNEKDIVLDFYAGSGTTAVATHKLNRKFIGVEWLDDNFSLILERLQHALYQYKNISNNSFVSIELHEKTRS